MQEDQKISEKVDKTLDAMGVAFDNKEKSWTKIQSKIDYIKSSTQVETKIVPIKKYKWSKLAIAASILLVLGASYMFSTNDSIKYQTAQGESINVSLPDGSIATLNSSSSISFDESEWDDNRMVDMEGEAYFEVKKGSDFTVISNQGEVKVLGTGFNIYDRKDAYKVGCTHGKVRVKSKNNEVLLVKGLYTELKDNNLLSPIRRDHINSWTEGKFYFEESPLRLVFKELERQYSIEISSQVDENRNFTGSFVTSSIEEALLMICEPMEITYSKGNDGKIIIKNK